MSSSAATLPSEPLPEEVKDHLAASSAFRVIGFVDVGLSCLALLLLLFAWAVLLRHRRRPLCALRVSLGFTATLWVLGLVASHGAVWGVVAELTDLDQALGGWDRDLLCGLHAGITIGFCEPASLLLIAALISAKTLPREDADVSWRLVRWSFGLALLVAVAQAVSVGLPLAGVVADNAVFDPLPHVLNASDGAVLSTDTWWRRGEGCANSAASVGVSTLFVVPFEVCWTVACYRLLGLIINLQLRSRLYCVQLTYTLVPVLLLLLRLALLVYDSEWLIGRRLMRDAELCLVLLSGGLAARSLLYRPVLEAARAAPLARARPPRDEDEPKPLNGLKPRAKSRIPRVKHMRLTSENLMQLSQTDGAPNPSRLLMTSMGLTSKLPTSRPRLMPEEATFGNLGASSPKV